MFYVKVPAVTRQGARQSHPRPLDGTSHTTPSYATPGTGGFIETERNWSTSPPPLPPDPNHADLHP